MSCPVRQDDVTLALASLTIGLGAMVADKGLGVGLRQAFGLGVDTSGGLRLLSFSLHPLSFTLHPLSGNVGLVFGCPLCQLGLGGA